MAIIIGVLVAVAGWLVNEFFARRAIRRNLRVEYLLSAYRRLEAASNRHMSAAHESALESAISDIQLLGSPRQVEMATAFARQFAADQRADTEPLLEDLRGSLRRELQLDAVPPQRMWLRITGDPLHQRGPAVGEEAWAVWEERSMAVTASLRAAAADAYGDGRPQDRVPRDFRDASRFVSEMLGLARNSPIGAVRACHQAVAMELRRHLDADGAGDVTALNLTELALLATERSLINGATRDGIEGIGVMHTMAVLDNGGQRLSEKQAQEYIGLTEGLLLALRLPPERWRSHSEASAG